MYDTEELWLDPEDMHIVNVDGTAVPAVEHSGRMWYQLAALFRALELQEAGYGGLSAQAGNLICNSGEALKYKDAWYGTIKGLRMFADRLHKDQCLHVNSIYRETAGIRYQAIMQWLSSVAGADVPNDDEELPQREYEVVDDAPSSVEADADADVPPDTVPDKQIVIRTARNSLLSDGPALRMMMDNLLDRVDLLGEILGIDQSLSREKRLAQIVWLLLFHNHDIIDSPAHSLASVNLSVSNAVYEAITGAMTVEDFLWQGKPYRSVRELVEAAMMV